MRLLITGTSGFIGTSMCERFGGNLEFDIHAIDKNPPRERFARVGYQQLDIRDRSSMSAMLRKVQPDVVIHLAAQSRVGPSLLDPVGTFENNTAATVSLLAALAETGDPNALFIYASSEAVYGPSDHYPVDEESPLNPTSPYAASKAASEHLVRTIRPRNSVIVRSGMGFGPRSNPSEQVVAKFINACLAGVPLRFPADLPERHHPTRDVNYVSNFVDGIQKIIERRPLGVFNIASGEEVSVLELARRVVETLGLGEVSFDSNYKYRDGEEGLRVWLDIAKARRELGYSPAVGLDEGIRRTAAWLKANPGYWDGTSASPY